MKQIILFFIMLTIHQLDAVACSCLPPKSFCEQSAKLIELSPENIIIVRGVVVDVVRMQHRRDLIIEIRESFHNPQNLRRIRIKDGTGADCGQNLENYRKGDELIFMTGFYEDEGIVGKFSYCNPGPLQVEKDRVKGWISNAKSDQEMSLNAFRNLLCIPSTDYISFYPNPTSDHIQIVASEISDTSAIEAFLFNPMGQIVLQHSPTVEERQMRSWTFPVQHLPEGTYFLHTVVNRNRRQVSKVIIMR